MKALQIIVEGQTELDFVKELIMPYLASHHIFNVRPISLETSIGHKGGSITYERFRDNVIRLLRGKEDMIVTSLIDYYKLHSDFPAYEKARQIYAVTDKVACLEKAIADDIDDKRLMPYIQLHEFEVLLFSDMKGFQDIEMAESSRKAIAKIIADHPNPELINDGDTTAPSKRLKNLIPTYNKPLFGNYIALENSFEKPFRNALVSIHG